MTFGSSSDLLQPDYPNKTLAVFGIYICIVGLFSHVLKTHFFLSEASQAVCLGIAAGPIGLGWVSLPRWTHNNADLSLEIVYQVTRIILGIQVLSTGIDLPKKYLKLQWRPLTTLLLPVMTVAWLVSSALIYGIAPGLTLVESLLIGACVTPTDPVLSATIVKGQFAEQKVDPRVRDLLSAESGANDGLGYPFLNLALALIIRREQNHTLGWAMGVWFWESWIYDIVLACAVGIVIGFAAQVALKFAKKHHYIEHEMFIASSTSLAFLCLGAAGTLGCDDILCCFVAGNVFAWDGYFRKQTVGSHFQGALDVLLDSFIFLFIGALIPWRDLGSAVTGMKAWQPVVIAMLILLLRRIPVTLCLYRWADLRNWKEGLFVGHFGPIGVGAVYYACVVLREVPESRTQLRELVTPIVFLIVFGSVIVHGTTVALVCKMDLDLGSGPVENNKTRDDIKSSTLSSMELPTTISPSMVVA